MSMRNPALFARIFNTPLMIHPGKLDAIIGGIGQRFGIEDSNILPEMAQIADGERKEPGYSQIGSVAVVSIFGVLAHRGKFKADSSYILGYDVIGKQIQAAINDPEITAVMLEMDSPGGEVAGCFELAQQIREWTAIKPIKSAVSSLSASANYLLAAACDEIVITDTGMAGSIGVVFRHVDVSKMAEKEGVKVTHIFAGAQKVDGNQFEPLSAEVKQRLQAEVNSLHDKFISRVIAYRGIDESVIRAQEAAVYTGQDAIKAGLADRIATADQLLADMQNNQINQNRNNQMAATTEAVNQSVDLQAVKSAELEDSQQKGRMQGAEQERTRISAILNHEEAKGREAQAQALALETDLQPEAAAKVLALSPKAESKDPAGADQFSQHMQQLGNPDVGQDPKDDDSQVVMQGWSKAFNQAIGHRGKTA